jgi:hypothetical protein
VVGLRIYSQSGHDASSAENVAPYPPPAACLYSNIWEYAPESQISPLLKGLEDMEIQVAPGLDIPRLSAVTRTRPNKGKGRYNPLARLSGYQYPRVRDMSGEDEDEEET